MVLRPMLTTLCLCALLLTSPVDAKKGEHGDRPHGDDENRPQGSDFGERPHGDDENRPQGSDFGERPHGDDENRPQGSDFDERPQGSDFGERPQGSGRGPPGVGVFDINGAENATLLSTVEFGSAPTMAVVDGNVIMVYHNLSRDENTGVPQLVMISSSDGGISWSTAELITINGLPGDVAVVVNPTLSSDGQYLYFTGASDKNLKESSSAIYVATYDGGVSFSNVTKTFSMDGAVMSDSAVANGLMVVPHLGDRHGDENTDDLNTDDDGMIPTISRKLLRRKPGRKPGHRGSNTAYLATCSTPTLCTFTQNITMPEQDSKNSFTGSMIYIDGQYEFYGTGPGPWPVTSADGTSWEPPVTAETLPSIDPSVVVYNGAKLVAARVKHSKPVESPSAPGPDAPVLA